MKIVKNKENNKEKIAQCFSYEVTMLVHVIADDETNAKIQLDDKGGIMTKREVKLLNSAIIYGEEKEAK